jgi:uncharacterized protein YjbJ (UPF0337 family)
MKADKRISINRSKNHGGGIMDKDRVKGTINDAAGRAKRQVGEWTDNGDLQVEGAAQQIKGKTQKVVGQVKDAARDAASNLDRSNLDRKTKTERDNKTEVDTEQQRERQRESERERAHHA